MRNVRPLVPPPKREPSRSARRESARIAPLMVSLALTLPVHPALAFANCESSSGEGVVRERRVVERAPQDADAVDADFLVQGEYRGRLTPVDGPPLPAALQVIARGEGQFDAVLYRGGFPGTGWTGEPLLHFSGGRENNDVVLHDRQHHWVARMNGSSTRHWYLVDAQANRLIGRLSGIRRQSATLGARPPKGALVLFDGISAHGIDEARLENARLDEDGLLQVGFTTRETVGDFFLHAEFRTPFEPRERGQGRGNSGVYIQRRYEVQILDSFRLTGAANECAGIYRTRAPDHQMALPPLSWQTYDLSFRTARWDREGNKLESARLTLRHNGIIVHDAIELADKTGAGQPESPEHMPILFQDHRNPVRFRNLWIVDDPALLAEIPDYRSLAGQPASLQTERVQPLREGESPIDCWTPRRWRWG